MFKRPFLEVAGHKRKKLKLGVRAIFPHDLRRMDWLGADLTGTNPRACVKFNDRENEILQKTTRNLIHVAQRSGGTYYLPYQLF
jgi:hypothetical protein